MTSTPESYRIGAVLLALACAQGCGLDRPPDPPPFDCATIDRAEERFPDECAEPFDGGVPPDGSAAP